MSTLTVGDVVGALDALYPPDTAEPWDVVGLTCGRRAAPVRRVMFAVDPLPAVIDEALAWDADLLVTHHPLLLRPVNEVSTDTWKGAALHALIGGGCALYTAHTNADRAAFGVNDALADLLGLRDVTPLRADPTEPTDKLVTYVPEEAAEAVVDALRRVGGGVIGNYAGCGWSVAGTGTFTPLPGAHPAIGEVGRTEVLVEVRVEMLMPRRLRAQAAEAIRAVHPYEEVAIDAIEVAASDGTTGLGRIGRLNETMSLAELSALVAARLPATPAGVRFHGDPERRISSVAVCGGAGDSLIADAQRAGADVLVTADLRHHVSSENLAAGGPALVDPGHWASEWPWLPVVAGRLRESLDAGGGSGTTLETHISTAVTDPVAGHVRSRPEEEL